MYYSVEEEKRIQEEQESMRSGEARNLNLCQYKHVSCVRCCLPHIGGDSHMEDSAEERSALFRKDREAYRLKYSNRYLGPGRIVMKFRNFNPRQDPRIEASQYEDSFPDVGQEEMERRFSERRKLFLDFYDPKKPSDSLRLYMEAVQRSEGYRYKYPANAGPVSQFLGGSVSSKRSGKGELPECQLLGFVDENGRVGCLAHPLAETAQTYDGRDQVGFFHHSGCCDSVGCEAGREFRFLSPSAVKVFDRAVEGMTWYAYSRHATSVLVYYLRSYDCLLQAMDKGRLLDMMTLSALVGFTNALFDAWPLRRQDGDADASIMNSLEILSADIPLAEKILYIALDTRFLKDRFTEQLLQARDYVERHMRQYVF